MRAGQLNRRLHLQAVVMTADSEGASVEAWADVDVVWASIDPIRGTELFQAAQVEEKISHNVTMRWRSDVTVKMRFLYSETPTGIVRIFLIHALIDPNEGHREIDCMCEEIVTSQVGAT